MIFPFASLLAVASVVSAIPFKRFDNGTVEGTTLSSQDSTITIDKYITITLPSSTMTVAETATSAISIAKVEAANEGVNLLDHMTSTEGVQVTPTSESNPKETAEAEPSRTSSDEGTVTSTITSVITVTNANGEVTKVPVATTDGKDTCEASTVTVTVTETPESASPVVNTLISLVPVTAEFTVGDTTTTLTQYVSVTLEQTSMTTLGSSTIAPLFTSYSNGTADHPSAKRSNLFYAF